MMSSERPTAGKLLEEAIRGDLPPHAELDPREEEFLRQESAQADDVAALEADIRERGHVLDDDSVNPSCREARQGREALLRLLSGIDLPEAAPVNVLRAERAARARWRQAS